MSSDSHDALSEIASEAPSDNLRFPLSDFSSVAGDASGIVQQAVLTVEVLHMNSIQQERTTQIMQNNIDIIQNDVRVMQNNIDIIQNDVRVMQNDVRGIRSGMEQIQQRMDHMELNFSVTTANVQAR